MPASDSAVILDDSVPSRKSSRHETPGGDGFPGTGWFGSRDRDRINARCLAFHTPASTAIANRAEATVPRTVPERAFDGPRTAATFTRGGTSGSSTRTTDATRIIMWGAGGQYLVALLVVVISIGGDHVFKGWSKKFLEDLVADPGEVAEQAGRYGDLAKGVALAIVGGLFIVAPFACPSERGPGPRRCPAHTDRDPARHGVAHRGSRRDRGVWA